MRKMFELWRTLDPRGRSRFARRRLASACLLISTSAACGGSPTAPRVELDPANVVNLQGVGVLQFEGAAAADPQRPRIEQIVAETVAAARVLVPLRGITIIVRFGSAGGVVPQLGLGGRADANTARMTIDPDSPVWVSSLDAEFGRVLAHELHHVARIRAVGFDSNLLQAIVREGLADHFVVEVAGGPPPIWATALSAAELETWLGRAQQIWLDPGVRRDPWFFLGPGSQIPHWTGYSIGFELTRRYLDAHPSQRASALYAEPATSFIPPD